MITPCHKNCLFLGHCSSDHSPFFHEKGEKDKQKVVMGNKAVKGMGQIETKAIGLNVKKNNCIGSTETLHLGCQTMVWGPESACSGL